MSQVNELTMIKKKKKKKVIELTFEPTDRIKMSIASQVDKLASEPAPTKGIGDSV